MGGGGGRVFIESLAMNSDKEHAGESSGHHDLESMHNKIHTWEMNTNKVAQQNFRFSFTCLSSC